MINGFEVAMELSIKMYYQRTFQWLLTCPICITVFDYLIEFANGNFTSGSKRKFPKYRSTENSITRLLNQLADLLFINLSNNTCVKDGHLKIRKSILQEIKSYKVINIALISGYRINQIKKKRKETNNRDECYLEKRLKAFLIIKKKKNSNFLHFITCYGILLLQ